MTVAVECKGGARALYLRTPVFLGYWLGDPGGPPEQMLVIRFSIVSERVVFQRHERLALQISTITTTMISITSTIRRMSVRLIELSTTTGGSSSEKLNWIR